MHMLPRVVSSGSFSPVQATCKSSRLPIQKLGPLPGRGLLVILQEFVWVAWVLAVGSRRNKVARSD